MSRAAEIEATRISFNVSPQPRESDYVHAPCKPQDLPWIASPAYLIIWRYPSCVLLKVKSSACDRSSHGFVSFDSVFRYRVFEDNDFGLVLTCDSGRRSKSLEVTFASRHTRREFLDALTTNGFRFTMTDPPSFEPSNGDQRLAGAHARHQREFTAPASSSLARPEAEYIPDADPVVSASARQSTESSSAQATLDDSGSGRTSGPPEAKRAKVDHEGSELAVLTLQQEVAMLVKEVNELRSVAARAKAEKAMADAKCRKLEAEVLMLRGRASGAGSSS
eukprot:TRINITY_DN75542_c0_g1_i1.p1 TRINITY_DN75542_c0_g1~~TRINITY_DN75542_c0_g1_i1.p1  ORF type:complete len:278 (+),score=21.91 TRINITY_DN75542_c0_g1_i1:31-864(+)